MSLNQSGITTKTGLAENQILSAPELAYSLSCKVANTGVNAGADSKKIVKAGTPVYGSLTARDTAFTVSGASDAKPVGIVILVYSVECLVGIIYFIGFCYMVSYRQSVLG